MEPDRFFVTGRVSFEAKLAKIRSGWVIFEAKLAKIQSGRVILKPNWQKSRPAGSF